MRRHAKRLGAGLLVLASVAVAALVAAQSSLEDPRNRYYKEALDARCMSCHETDNPPMRPMVVGFEEAYRQVVPGQPFRVAVVVVNPWNHQLLDIAGRLDATNATGFEILGEPPRPDHTQRTEHELHRSLDAGGIPVRPPDTTDEVPVEFPVEDNATRIRIRASTHEGVGADVGQPARLELEVYPPGRRGEEPIRPAGAQAPNQTVADLADPVRLASLGTGPWQAVVRYAAGLDPSVPVVVEVLVSYAPEGEAIRSVAAPIDGLFPQERTVLEWNLVARPEAAGVLDFRIRARAHYVHPVGLDADDDGVFLRFAKLEARAGPSFVSADAPIGPQKGLSGPVVNVLTLATRLAGFSSAVLVPLVMASGGMFGKASRRWMNGLVGGARRRILWHASTSWAIVGVATLHLALALLESRSPWTLGILWGGAGFVAMASLGLTGSLQVRIIKRWNYATWRRWHLGAAIGMFFVGLLHILVDGSDLAPLREAWPVLERLRWP